MKPQRFLRKERLTAKRDFAAVFNKGEKKRSYHLLHACLLKKPGKMARLGLIVSKKVGNAVVRNRVKRRLREIFRKNKEKILTGADVVLIAKPGIQNCTSGELEKIFLFEILKNHVRLP